MMRSRIGVALLFEAVVVINVGVHPLQCRMAFLQGSSFRFFQIWNAEHFESGVVTDIHEAVFAFLYLLVECPADRNYSLVAHDRRNRRPSVSMLLLKAKAILLLLPEMLRNLGK